MERYEGLDFHKNSLGIECQNNLVKWMPFGFFFQAGNSIYYDPDDPSLGWSNTYEVFAELKPDRQWRLGVDNNLLRDELGNYGRTDCSIFLKFSYWWRM
jgi:hypothetical protein